MQRLIYISTTRFPFDKDALDALLRISRRKNAAADVTGLLVVGGRRFLQALEGPDDAVARTFDRIAHDPRHFGIVRLSTTTVETRAFGRWAMGSLHVSTADDMTGTLREIVDRLVAPIKDAGIRAEFRQFAALHSLAA